jgi:translation initiation factor 4A
MEQSLSEPTNTTTIEAIEAIATEETTLGTSEKRRVTDESATSKMEVSNYDPSYIISGWDDLNISTELLRSIHAYGYESPSPIQTRGIVPIIRGLDTIGQAQSGTGKTATFVIGALARLVLTEKTTQVIMLAPTRELASQILKVLIGLSRMMEGLRTQLIVGGNSVEEDINLLRKATPHVVVGCPGRVMDMMKRSHISPNSVRLVVVDEADEMFSSGFKDQIYSIFQFFKKDVQVALFSATLPEDMFAITEKFMRNPVKIKMKTESLTLEGISQYFVASEDDSQKYDILKDIFSAVTVSQCIIYCNSVRRVVELHEAMRDDGFPVCCIHSDMDSDARRTTFEKFTIGEYRVMISSNVTARGIDVQQVSTVINFDLPKDNHTYLHRIGRGGRWGRKGTGISFITKRDVPKIKDIESYYQCEINEMPSDLSKLMR